MYQLYYYPLNASMAPHFILEALTLDFELVLVDRKTNAQKSDAYLALNPLGRIPTLVEGDLVLFESPAICIHLAESVPSSNLMPKVGTQERARCFQWMMFFTNTLQADIMMFFYPDRYANTREEVISIVEKAEQRITDIWAMINLELEDKPYLLGDNISVCDFFLFMLSVWTDELKKPPLAFKAVSRYLKKLAKHPAIVTVCEKEGLSLLDYQ